MKTVAVTGGSGFIGKKLVEMLSQGSCTVRVLSRKSDSVFPGNVKVIGGDLVDEDCPLSELLEKCDTIYHCAGELSDESVMRALHVEGTQRLIDAAQASVRQSGKQMHWVQLSSVGAYGPSQITPNAERTVTEDTATSPSGEYEVTKTQSDELVMQASKQGFLTYTIVRPSNVFGVGMPNQSLRQLGKMVQKKMFFYIGPPGAVATYIHVDDVVEVLMLCGMDQRAKGRVFNVSNDCALEEMISGIASSLNVTSPKLRLPEQLVRMVVKLVSSVTQFPLTQERIDALVSRTRYPSTKLERELGFVPNISVYRAIGEIV